MEFVVQGADPADGRDVTVTIDAADAAAAEAAARSGGMFVCDVRPAGRRWRQVLFGTPGRRRRALAGALVVALVPALAWWVSVKDELFAGSAGRGEPTVAPQPAAAAASAQETQGGPAVGGRSSASPTDGLAGENARLRFVKREGGPLWNRVDRASWLRSNPAARLVAEEAATGFKEYGDDRNLLAKQHAVFVADDRMAMWELMVIRRDAAAAEREVRQFEAALGPADFDTPPDTLPAAERATVLSYRQWRLIEGGRRISVRCMVRETEAVAADGTYLRPIYFQQTFADLDVVEARR